MAVHARSRVLAAAAQQAERLRRRDAVNSALHALLLRRRAEQLIEPAAGAGDELDEHFRRIRGAGPFGAAQVQAVPVEQEAQDARVRRFNEPAVDDELRTAEFVLRPDG